MDDNINYKDLLTVILTNTPCVIVIMVDKCLQSISMVWLWYINNIIIIIVFSVAPYSTLIALRRFTFKT